MSVAGEAPERLPAFDELVWRNAAGEANSRPLKWLVEASREVERAHVTVETVIAVDENPLGVFHERLRTPTELRTRARAAALKVLDHRGPYVLSAWPDEAAGVYHLVGSLATTDSRWNRITNLLSHGAGDVFPCFLDHKDFQALGSALSEFGTVEVGRLTARKRMDWSSWNRGWSADTGLVRPNHMAAIAEAENVGAVVRTMTLHVANALDVHIRRISGATYYSGDFAIFEKVVMRRLANSARQRLALLRGRERSVESDDLRPIQIKLADDQLRDAEATGMVLEFLQKQRSVGVAVLHRNPYFHAVVTDFSDGSNFDVLVTDSDSLEIFPGFRASLRSLGQLAQGLSERFGAVEIGEEGESPTVTLEQLASRG